VTDQVGDHIEVRFRRRMDYHLHGLSYEVQASPDLTGQNWTTAPTSAVGIPVPTGDGVTEVLTLRISNLPTPRNFSVCRFRPGDELSSLLDSCRIGTRTRPRTGTGTHQRNQ
jgi:hypothetical protein